MEHLAFMFLPILTTSAIGLHDLGQLTCPSKKWEEEEEMSEDQELKGAWCADNRQEGIQHNHCACWKVLLVRM